MTLTSIHHVASQFHSEIIQCGLQDRMIGGLVSFGEASWRIVFVRSGAVQVMLEGGPVTTEAPALIWQPLDQATRMRVKAGSVGAQLQLGEQGVSNAIGRKPEAAELRMMALQPIQLALGDMPQTELDTARAFDVILREGQSMAPGSETIIEAQVRVLLVHLWRHVSQTDQLKATIATSSQILQTFRQLLEVHFRERWGVNDYADALGLSADRLQDVCRRTLAKTPLRLIHERTIYEAQSLLVRSNRTVDQIAHFLGFKSAGQFSKFFRSVMGVPPGEFRKAQQAAQLSEDRATAVSFADWP